MSMGRCRQIVGWMLLGLLGCLCPAVGQERLPEVQALLPEELAMPALSETQLQEMTARMEQFLDDLAGLSVDIPVAKTANAVTTLRRRLTGWQVRWDAYYALMQMDIAQSEVLLELVAQLQDERQKAAEAIEHQQQVVEALVRFGEAERQFPAFEKSYE